MNILKFTFFFSFCLLSINNLEGQNKITLVTYKMTLNTQQLNDSIEPTIKNRVKLMAAGAEFIECELKFNNKKGMFKQVVKMEVDINPISYKLASVLVRGNFYKSIEDSTKTLNKEFSGKTYNISLPFDESHWIITKDTKRINDYLCYKAMMYSGSKKKIETIAWFTPEVPVPFGPNGIDGLPGLVLETEVNGLVFYATRVREDKTNGDIEKPMANEEISEEEFLEMVKSKTSYIFER